MRAKIQAMLEEIHGTENGKHQSRARIEALWRRREVLKTVGGDGEGDKSIGGDDIACDEGSGVE